jgi:hypothetical protein
MVTPGSDPPATTPPPQTSWNLTMGLGLFCVIGGLFLAAGLKEALWPKVLAIGGIVIMVVGGVGGALMARRRPSREN